jgi:hypothetical protein
VAETLNEAISACEALLEKERRDGADEALVLAKEAAVQRLADLIAEPGYVPEPSVELAERLKALMAGNRFSLKWSGLRAKLGQLGSPVQPKAPSGADRPRVDLVF